MHRCGVLIAAVLVAVVAGCSSGVDDEDSVPTSEATVTTEGSVPEVSTAPSAGDQFQAQVLADGVVTDEEFAAAQGAKVACMIERGVPAHLADDGVTVLFEGDPDEGLAVFTECQDEFADDITVAYMKDKLDS